MKMRIIDTGLKNAAWNMAADQALLEIQNEHPQPTLRFLSFKPECVLVGYFQTVKQEIRENYCIENGIHINRRITGGGTIYFDPSQIGWEIIAPHDFFPYPPHKMYEIVGQAIAKGISKLGVDAVFKPRNDIEVNGKKISGMGGATFKNAFLFQGTLLVKDKISEMLYALKVPIDKLKPKEIDSVKERVTCLELETGKTPDRESIKNSLVNSLSKEFSIDFQEGRLSEKELNLIERKLPFFSSDKWINRIKLPPESQGQISGTYRSNEGTIRINMVVNSKQNALRSTLITGDFFVDDRKSLNDMERLLKNIPMKPIKIIKAVEDFLISHSFLPKEDIFGAFKEVFKKWEWIKQGFTPQEVNHIFNVNFEPGDAFKPRVFLFPYCSKKADCTYRFKNECIVCDLCSVGEGYKLAMEHGLEPITIVSFENLIETFEKLKKKGITDYIGSCCEAFYIKHQDAFRESNLKGLLINVESSTCYDLGQAKLAYEGKFESETNLNLKLINKVLNYIKQKNF